MRVWAIATSLLLVFTARAARADETPPKPEAEAPPAMEESDEPVDLPPHKTGPLLVDLGDGVEIDLPAGMILFEKAEARRQLDERGDYSDEALAIVTRPDADWELDIDLSPIGYVSDEDADELDAGQLLKAMKEGTAEQNKVRAKKGVAPLEVIGWSKQPAYDRQHRVLSWSTDLMSEGQRFLNEDHNILGRRGYVGAILIGSTDTIEAARIDAAPAINAIHFQPGHRYEEFDPKVDKDSGIGLRELVVGGGAIAVASKLGLFAKFAIVLKKAFLAIAAAIGGFWKWLTGKRKKAAAAESAAAE